jgi:D-tagatose-1,6-bisphosphate aldolase subunit GatZ/KbaZ
MARLKPLVMDFFGSNPEHPGKCRVGMLTMLDDILQANRRGACKGVYAACTVNRFAIQAALGQARRDRWPVLIEATAQQVNPEGGYSGLTPAAFAVMVRREAALIGLDQGAVILGGDHAGPHPWSAGTAIRAMAKARALVQALVGGGFAKLHLDATAPCRGDPRETHGGLPMGLIVARTVDLMDAAEKAARRARCRPPIYVLGSEVPLPGGGAAGGRERVSPPEEIEAFVAAVRAAMQKRGLAHVRSRVAAIVARTGADFSSRSVQPFDAGRAAPLVTLIDTLPDLVYEAHSTDYQTPQALGDMVASRMAILKVGPWLTYAFREAAFALARIEGQTLAARRGVQPSRLVEAMEAAMLADPQHWRRHYRGSAEEKQWLRIHGLSDRIRYYWHYPGPQAAFRRLVANLRRYPPPAPLLAEHLPAVYAHVADGRLAPEPEALIRHQIGAVIAHYAEACGARD